MRSKRGFENRKVRHFTLNTNSLGTGWHSDHCVSADDCGNPTILRHDIAHCALPLILLAVSLVFSAGTWALPKPEVALPCFYYCSDWLWSELRLSVWAVDLCWFFHVMFSSWISPLCGHGHRLHLNHRARRSVPFCFVGSPICKS